jgi:diadenosine tetraphosphate (Ap4A) HIT family hydrolase
MENFLSIPSERIVFEDDFFFIIRDIYPVSPGHSLIVSKTWKRDYFELSELERQNLEKVILKAKELVELDFQPDGYNIGINCGEVAGQTVFHFHCHLIPRYKGDMENPRGGVRHVIEGKGFY